MAKADDSVLSLCKQVWQWRLSESPELASFCGVHQYDEKWDDISEDAYKKREVKLKEFFKIAKALDVSNCSDGVALTYKLLVDDLSLHISGMPYKSYYLPLNYLEGIHTDSNLIISYMRFKDEKDFQVLEKKLCGFPARIAQVVDMLKEGIKKGIVNARYSMEDIPGQVDTIISTPTEDWGLMKPFKDGNHSGLASDVLEKYKTKCANIIKTSIILALADLKCFVLKEYLANVRLSAGISTLPNGVKWYQQCLNFHLTTPKTPQEVHDIGLKEVARINAKIVALAKKEGLPETMPELLQAIEKKQAHTFKSQDEVLKYVKDLCYYRIRPKLTQYFKNLPDIEMKIVLSPPYRSSAPEAYYLNGTPDGSRDGTYFVNANNLQVCLPYIYPALSLHEGEPGHHLQGSYSLAAKDLPDFRRFSEDAKYYMAPNRFGYNTAYSEGWGLYCEALGEEMGVYSTNLELIGRLNMEVFRATRLVVDTGMHAMGWTMEKAVEYMNKYTLQNMITIRNEVKRYITWPGQACAYKIGEIKIWELRHKAEQALGSKFDIKEFHHRVLACGAVPLNILEIIVDDYIRETPSD